jgi:hypothetical protein
MQMTVKRLVRQLSGEHRNMLLAMVLGCLLIVGNMAIQVMAVVLVLRILLSRLRSGRLAEGLSTDVFVISVVLIVLLVGHMLQFATWAFLFVQLGEFAEFSAAFYHSAVNFTSLGYGDIVMSERWRLLGGLEAANGVLMFGLSAGTILAVMNQVFSRHIAARRPE